MQSHAQFQCDPLNYVRWNYPWQVEGGKLADYDGPDVWQKELLEHLGDEYKARLSRQKKGPVRVAVRSGHGIGKSAISSWIIKHFIACFPNPQIVVTANTKNQLETKTWRELNRWNSMGVDGGLFDHSATKFAHKSEPETWFASAIPWTKENSEAFAGTHERYVLVVFDEASAIDDSIWEVIEGALTTEDGICVFVCFGNPTKNTGKFRQCFGKQRARWHGVKVDSREAKMTDKTLIQEWIDDYGIDSDFVRVRVLGEFPSASSAQFINGDAVDRCVDYSDPNYFLMPIVIGVDVARFGDDQTVICVRQGRHVFPLSKYRGLDMMQVADKVAEHIEAYNPANVVIDSVGIGAGVYDRLKQLGYNEVLECNAGAKAQDEQKYINKRAEMWDNMRVAINEELDLPNDPEFIEDLIAPEYGFNGVQKLQLEKKEDMKRRGLASPDCGDALALTFAYPVRDRIAPNSKYRQNQYANGDYLSNRINGNINRAKADYL